MQDFIFNKAHGAVTNLNLSVQLLVGADLSRTECSMSLPSQFLHRFDGDRNTIERALRCRGLIEYVKRGPWKSTGLLEDSSNTGGKISNSQVEDVGAFFSAVCIGIVCSPSTAVPGLGGGAR